MVDKFRPKDTAKKPGLPTITKHPDSNPPPQFINDLQELTLAPYFVASDEILSVPINKQLAIFSGIDIEGELDVDGQFFVET